MTDFPPEDMCIEAGLPMISGHRWTWEDLAWAYRGLWYEETGDDPSEGI